MAFRPPGSCPVCGTSVPARARACPECGADERSGWSDDAQTADLNLPGEDDFDYEEFTRREFGGKPARTGIPRLWVWVAGLMALTLILLWIVLPLVRTVR
jgi:hypothetical protein